MKPLFLLTVAAASVLFGSAVALAQPVQPLPHEPPRASRSPTDPGTMMPYRDGTALPNRRTPSLTTPQRDEKHPFTPDEAWPKAPDSRTPLPPSLKPGTQDDRAGKIYLDGEQTDPEESIKLP